MAVRGGRGGDEWRRGVDCRRAGVDGGFRPIFVDFRRAFGAEMALRGHRVGGSGGVVFSASEPARMAVAAGRG